MTLYHTSYHGHRRAQSDPNGMYRSVSGGQLPWPSRRARSAPASAPLPAVHERWVGRKPSSYGRRHSNPMTPSEETEERGRKGYTSPLDQSPSVTAVHSRWPLSSTRHTLPAVCHQRDSPRPTQVITSAIEESWKTDAHLRQQAPWNNLLPICVPPVAARPPSPRRPSMPSTRGRMEGNAIPRRTSSLATDDMDKATANGMQMNASPKAPERTPFTETFTPNINKVPTPCTGSPSSPGTASPPSAPARTHSVRLNRSPSSASSSTSPPTSLTSSRSPIVDHLQPYPRAGNASPERNQNASPQPRRPASTLSMETKSVPHWSVQGVGRWVRHRARSSRPLTPRCSVSARPVGLGLQGVRA